MIRVLLAEDQAMVRGALSALLKLESDLDVIGMGADPARQTRCRRHRHRNAAHDRARTRAAHPRA
jgi:DNA-binding NarL/FixJ family response regulator